ncbi:MAG: CPBP family intramembrane glutamic endopeptidase [Nitrososphaerales archaeon]
MNQSLIHMLTLPPSIRRYDQVLGFLIVALTMIEMFVIPKSYFVLGSVVSTSAMICVAFLLLNGVRGLFKPSVRLFVLALFVAILLYLVFYAGNLGIKAFPLMGVSTASEQSIYGLFNKVSLPILIVVFILDAVGFESYFRGNILTNLSQRIGIGSVFAAAALDAAIHFSTFNPLFPATTFIADTVWGFYYYKTRDLSSTIACHFVWDIMIFVLIPIH